MVHRIANVLETPVDFRLTWQWLPPSSRSLHAANLRGGQRVDLGDIHQRLDANLFSFRIARPAGRSIVHGFNAIAAENAGVGTPRDNFALWTIAHHSLVIRVNGGNHGMVLPDAGARNGHVGLEFETPVRMLPFEIEENRLNVPACLAHGNRRRDAHVEKQIGFFRCAAGPPGVAATNSAQIDDGLLSAVGRLFLPVGRPLHNRLHQFMHTADRVHFFAAFTECRMHVNAGARNADPHRTEMLQHDVHFCRLAEDAHVREHTVIHQVVRAIAVATIFLALVLAPLRFLDFAGDGRYDHVALELHASAVQRPDRMRVTNECAFHVVDAKAVNDTLLNDGVWLVTDADKKFLATRVRRVHVAIEHQVLPAAGAGPPANDVGAPFFHFLPGHSQAQLPERATHVFRHLQLFARRTWDVDDVAGHRDNFLFAYGSENAFDQLGIEA